MIQILLYGYWMRILSPVAAMSRFGKALADPTRAAVLLQLQLQQGPAVPSELAARIGVSRQIVSNHLACLRDCGLVVGGLAVVLTGVSVLSPAAGRTGGGG